MRVFLTQVYLFAIRWTTHAHTYEQKHAHLHNRFCCVYVPQMLNHDFLVTLYDYNLQMYIGSTKKLAEMKRDSNNFQWAIQRLLFSFDNAEYSLEFLQIIDSSLDALWSLGFPRFQRKNICISNWPWAWELISFIWWIQLIWNKHSIFLILFIAETIWAIYSGHASWIDYFLIPIGGKICNHWGEKAESYQGGNEATAA